MEGHNDLGEFEVDGGAGDNDELYQAMPRHTPHHTHNEHHVSDGGAPPINKGVNARPTVNPNERSNALSDVSTSLDSKQATGGKGRRGKKKCSCCNTSPCLCRSGKCKSCGKTGGDCGCMGGKTSGKMLGGATGGKMLGGATGGKMLGGATGGKMLGGATGGKMLGGVMGGRARSKSKTRAKSKGKRAKSKGKNKL